MIYKHWSEAPQDARRWPNFPFNELACRCCGEFYYCPETMDRIQRARFFAGRPIFINSGHRCALHNARVGGAPLSEHKKIALDCSIRGYEGELERLLYSLKQAGFTTFGFYGTFVHTDIRQSRFWVTSAGRKTWNGLIS